MLKLGVNIDHVATLRQARYTSVRSTPGRPREASGAIPEPDPVWAVVEAELAGAHGVTVHLREDRRHIQDRDVRLIRQVVRTSLNLEMADVPEIVAFAEEVCPTEVCLVPEKRQEVTTEGGLDVASAAKSLARTGARLQKAGIAVSLFVDPDGRQIRAAADVGADFVELHTGRYANARGETEAAAEIRKLTQAAELAHKLGLRVNAGHGLNYQNTPGILAVPHLEMLNTGHSIVARALFVGLRQAIREMLKLMGNGQPGDGS
ncbi:MAG TPA: pyridoxine 5'-phosphate synthase [Verrucomicrobiae bacterium]|nr:pyridoxine 5'-phosphate synthase [Verrucomicrobiae bacterium]